MKTYDFDNIIGVNAHFLLYLDENDEQQELPLKCSCEQLTNRYQLSDVTDLLGNPVNQSQPTNFVCRADKSSDMPYYEFYEESGENIRFQLEIRPGFLDYFRSGWKERFYNRLDEFEKQLRLFGYHVYIE